MGHATEEEASDAPAVVRFLLHLFDSKLAHVVLFLLLVVDVGTVVASGFLDTQFLLSKVDDCKAYVDACVPAAHRRLADRPPAREAEGSASWRLLASSSSGTSSSNSVDCGGHPHFGNHALHDAEKILAYISIAILSLFIVEQVLRIIATKCAYFKKPLHILDFFVITASLLIEILVMHLPMSGLLVLCRLWRFVRTGYTTAEGLHDVHRVSPALGCLANDAMMKLHVRLPEKRWKALAKQRTGELSIDETSLAVDIAKASPGLVLHAMALENERLRDSDLPVPEMANGSHGHG